MHTCKENKQKTSCNLNIRFCSTASIVIIWCTVFTWMSRWKISHILGYNQTIRGSVIIQAPSAALSRHPYISHNYFHPNLAKCRFQQLCIHSKRNVLPCLISLRLFWRILFLPPLNSVIIKNTKQIADPYFNGKNSYWTLPIWIQS